MTNQSTLLVSITRKGKLKGRNHQLISGIKRSPLRLALIGTIISLFLLLGLLFYYYPNISINSTISGTLFAVLLTGIISIAGIIFKASYDFLDVEKKKNEKLLETALKDAEKYYYPISIAAQFAGRHLIGLGKEILKVNKSMKMETEKNPQDTKFVKKIGTNIKSELITNDYRIAYSLYLLGNFYTQKFKLEVEKGGDIILRNKGREKFLRQLYNRTDQSIIWTGKDEIIHSKSILLYTFLKDSKGDERTSAFTFAEFSNQVGLPTNPNPNKKSELRILHDSFKSWVMENPEEVFQAGHLLNAYGSFVETYFRELSTFWYHDNESEAHYDLTKLSEQKSSWEKKLKEKYEVEIKAQTDFVETFYEST